jgi:hypothetical protein
MRDTIEMARESGLLTWLKPPEDVIERFKAFEALVRADEREALQDEVLEQCRIIAMGAEREDSLRAELTRLKASIALDKKAENARELGLDYEPAMTKPSLIARCTLSEQCLPDAPYRAMLCELHKDMLDEIDHLKAAQPAPVKTYHDGKPWPVAQKPWVGLSEAERRHLRKCNQQHDAFARAIEAKLKGKNHG